MYCEDHNGRYPDPNRWCDLLIENNYLDAKYLYCPEVKFRWRRQVSPWPIPKKYKCYYAVNPDCEPNSPADVVLAFETKGGWNKAGGPELLSTENHRGIECCILYNDGRAEFIYEPDQLNYLKWK
jgi:hypothetical protein